MFLIYIWKEYICTGGDVISSGFRFWTCYSTVSSSKPKYHVTVSADLWHESNDLRFNKSLKYEMVKKLKMN